MIEQPTYTKQQFLKSKSFTPQEKDALDALLENEKTYTVDQVQKTYYDFLKKEVTGS